ncbi:MFS transporter [Phytohabitans rumicis]|uniref:MFS transporter n=1 Tax=Phytohabitans rumicis TaxID=1076125 RepID=A0A6V8LQZ3_9ACTN|nr:MFS transporter [Phytohabitans rumicis]GFJ96537.1 MFS transporter [Phytohabitans rumicis]
MGLPSIQRDFGLSATDTQWIVSAALLAWGGLLLLGGRTADYFGRRRVFMLGLALFLVTSLLSGLAWNGGVLIAMRALHGVSAALMYPTALSILANTFTEGRPRNRALAFWAGMGGVGSTLGLLLGGAVVDRIGWHWGFLLQVPITATMLVLCVVLLPADRATDRPRTMDIAGALTVTAGLGLIVYTVAEAPAVGWTSARTLGMTAVALAALALFVVVESRSAAPLLPLRMLRSRLRLGGNVVIFVVTAIAFSMTYLYALYAQQVLGYSPLRYAIAGAVFPLTVIVAAYLGQLVLHRVGYRPIAVLGTLLFGAGSLLFTRVAVDSPYFGLSFFGLVLLGAGLGTGTLAASAAALTDVDAREAGLASGVNAATVMIGGGLGVAVVATIAASRTGDATSPEALTEGFRAGFTASVVISAVGLVLAVALLGSRRRGSRTTGVPLTIPQPRSGDTDLPSLQSTESFQSTESLQPNRKVTP